MRDSQRATFLYMLGYLPMALALVLFIILGTPLSVENSIIVISLALGGVLYTIIFRFHPHVQHYMEAVNEFDKNYCYVKEAQ